MSEQEHPSAAQVLAWLIQTIEENRDRYKALETDCWARVANPKNKLDEEKAKAQIKYCHHILNSLNWMLSHHRPWVKANEANKKAEWTP